MSFTFLYLTSMKNGLCSRSVETPRCPFEVSRMFSRALFVGTHIGSNVVSVTPMLYFSHRLIDSRPSVSRHTDTPPPLLSADRRPHTRYSGTAASTPQGVISEERTLLVNGSRAL